MEDGQLAQTGKLYRGFSRVFHAELALELFHIWNPRPSFGPSSEPNWTNGLNFWPRMQGKVPTIFRHVPILELSGGHVELGDNTCLVHFFELGSVRQNYTLEVFNHGSYLMWSIF